MNRKLVCTGEKQLRIVEEPIPKPPPKGVVIKVTYAGICHTDVHYWLNSHGMRGDQYVTSAEILPGFKFPVVLGHEIAGEVYALGNEVEEGSPELKIGDRVQAYPWTGCATCDYCKADLSVICKDPYFAGLHFDGGFQEYCTIRTRKEVMKVPDSLPMDLASLLTCSGLTTYHAVLRVIPMIQEAVAITGKSSLLLIGAGGLGLWATEWAKALLPKECKVFQADITEDKLKDAKNCGADGLVFWDTKLSDDKLVERTKSICGDVNAIIDFVGIETTNYKAYKSLRLGGTIVVVGIAGGSCAVPLSTFPYSTINVQGILVGTYKQQLDSSKLVAQRKIAGPPIEHVKLEDVEKILNRLVAGTQPGRAVIKF